MNSNGIGGVLFIEDDDGIIEVPFVDSTTTPEIDYWDEVSNFVRLSDTHMLWVTFVNSKSITSIPRSQLNEGGDHVGISVSGDKAIIFSTTKIMYFKHIATDNVKLISEKALPSGTDLTATDIKLTLKLSCTCASLKRFACFSSTLNCLIVKKGVTTCYKADILLAP